MKAKLKKNQGFTLIELIVVVGIVGSVAAVAVTFLLNNYKIFNHENQKIDIQHEAQTAMNEIIDQVIAAKEMESITYNPEDSNTLNTMIFRMIDDQFIGYIYGTENDIKVLKKGEDNDANIDDMDTYALYVDACEIILLPEGEAQAEHPETVQGVRVKITCKKEGTSTTLTNEVYFRNWRPIS